MWENWSIKDRDKAVTRVDACIVFVVLTLFFCFLVFIIAVMTATCANAQSKQTCWGPDERKEWYEFGDGTRLTYKATCNFRADVEDGCMIYQDQDDDNVWRVFCRAPMTVVGEEVHE